MTDRALHMRRVLNGTADPNDYHVLESIVKDYPWFLVARAVSLDTDNSADPALALHCLSHPAPCSSVRPVVAEIISPDKESIYQEVAHGIQGSGTETLQGDGHPSGQEGYANISNLSPETILLRPAGCPVIEPGPAVGDSTLQGQPDPVSREIIDNYGPYDPEGTAEEYWEEDHTIGAIQTRARAQGLSINGGENDHKQPPTPQQDVISRFLAVGERRIVPDPGVSDEDVAAGSSRFEIDDESLSEELAGIYLSQGLVDDAGEIYRRLGLIYPEKSVYFAQLIERIRRGEELENEDY